MHRFLASAIFVLMTTALLAAQDKIQTSTAVTDVRQLASKPKADLQSFSIEKLYMTRSVGATSWSRDGKSIAFVSNISGRNNLWIVPAQGGWPVQLTISDQRQSSPVWSPDGKWIAYISDYDGDEQWDVFLVSPLNGQVMNLTDTRQAMPPAKTPTFI